MDEYLKTLPFDIYEMHLFRLVVRQGSFTKAAQLAGLTQSAVTRQIQGMEQKLGIDLLERTTRVVRPTAAGQFLSDAASRLADDVRQTLQSLREEYAGAKKQIRVGVSKSIGLAYLPGFFHASLRALPEISCQVSHQPSQGILAALQNNDLDIGVVSVPQRLPHGLKVTHKFADAFVLIAPSALADDSAVSKLTRKALSAWVNKQRWLLLSQNSRTGGSLRTWMSRCGWQIDPAMELEDFDLIINLVSLGLGVSFVPIRALALYGRKTTLKRIHLPQRFVRELVVVIRKNAKTPAHLSQFVDNILF